MNLKYKFDKQELKEAKKKWYSKNIMDTYFKKRYDKYLDELNSETQNLLGKYHLFLQDTDHFEYVLGYTDFLEGIIIEVKK